MARRPNISRQTRAVLAALADMSQTWRHGYDLCRTTGLKSGTLYPLLARLKDQGLLESRWEPPQAQGRPPRHAYRLTAQGVAAARAAEPEPAEPLGRRIQA